MFSYLICKIAVTGLGTSLLGEFMWWEGPIVLEESGTVAGYFSFREVHLCLSYTLILYTKSSWLADCPRCASLWNSILHMMQLSRKGLQSCAANGRIHTSQRRQAKGEVRTNGESLLAQHTKLHSVMDISLNVTWYKPLLQQTYNIKHLSLNLPAQVSYLTVHIHALSCWQPQGKRRMYSGSSHC